MITAREPAERITAKPLSYDVLDVAGWLADWLLVIRRGKPGLKSYREDVYAVQLDGSVFPDGADAVALLLLKVDSPDGEVYGCTVFPPESGGRFTQGSCDCTAGRINKACAHRECLQDAFWLAPLTQGEES